MKVQNQSNFTQMAQQKKRPFSTAITAPNTQQMISRALKNERMAARFTSTLISAVSASEQLKECDPGTIIAAGLRGEGMGLIYGHGYYIVPYGSVAQFNLGYKGYIQLAMSTGFYEDIDCIEVREGEREGRDARTGKPIINLAKYETDEERDAHKIIGYYAYYKLNTGSFRMEYWPMDKLLRHADRYSPAFKLEKYNALINGELDAKEQSKLLNGTPWYDVNGGQDRMCKKTVLRSLLNSGYAPLSNEVRNYFNEDREDGVVTDIPAASVESAIPVTDFSVSEENHGRTEETTAEPPTSAAVGEDAPSEGKDTVPAEKRTRRKETANAAVESAKDFTDGFFGEGE